MTKDVVRLPRGVYRRSAGIAGLRYVVFIADRTQARSAQHEVPAGRGFEAQPVSRQNPQKMPA